MKNKLKENFRDLTVKFFWYEYVSSSGAIGSSLSKSNLSKEIIKKVKDNFAVEKKHIFTQ